MVEIRIKEYNNKSRKGKYVYIKEPNKRARILKYHTGVPESIYEYIYDNNINWTELNTVKKIFKPGQATRKTLTDTLNKGITEYRTTLGRLTEEGERQRAYAALVQPLLKKISPNMRKLVYKNLGKHRGKFTYRIEGTVVEQGRAQTGLEILDIGGKNIEEFVQVYHNKLRIKPGKIISNQGGMKEEIAQLAHIHKDNVKIHETNKRLGTVQVLIRFVV